MYHTPLKITIYTVVKTLDYIFYTAIIQVVTKFI